MMYAGESRLAYRRSNTLRCPAHWAGMRTVRGCDSGEARRTSAEGAMRDRLSPRKSLRQKDGGKSNVYTNQQLYHMV